MSHVVTDRAEPAPPGEYLEAVPLEWTRNDPVLASNELVLFFGPPFCGKTRYYNERLSVTHRRVSARETFLANPRLSLHLLAKQVCAMLTEGLNVVLDDEHMKSETRKCYLDMVRQRAPQVRVRAVNFWPFGGMRQCLWAREFVVTELNQSGGFATTAEVREWFSSSLKKAPKRFDGYSHVLNVRSYLYANSKQEFLRSALFVDCASLVAFVPVPGAEMCEARVRFPACSSVFAEWLAANPNGVIVVVAPESLVFPASVELYADDQLTFLQLLEAYHQQLLGQLSLCAPFGAQIHTVGTTYAIGEETWWLPPNPGMIAAAQRIHGIDLFSSTFACNDDSPWRSIAREMGFATIRSERLFQSRDQCGWALGVRMRKYGVKADAKLAPEWMFTRSIGAAGSADLETDLCKSKGDVADCWWQPIDSTAAAVEPVTDANDAELLLAALIEEEEREKRERDDKGKEEEDDAPIVGRVKRRAIFEEEDEANKAESSPPKQASENALSSFSTRK